MRPLTLLAWSVLAAGVAVGEEKSSTMGAPLPRVRLDPVTRTAVTEPDKASAAPASPSPAASSVVTMDRYVVKGKYVVPVGPMELPEPTGPFTLQGGGRLYGGGRFEAGMWPHVNILAKDAKFKAPQTMVSWDFLRLKW
ncbi:MAG: hypothetical protein NTV51_26150 [Verrucomicrobia bacterium]|nr:hypothetical protein [Verrucomicrobiota bacterium]